MAAPESNPLTPLFQELNKFIQISDFEKAQKIANKILTHPNGGYTNQKAILCKIVCLIHLGRFEDAHEFIKRNEDNITEDFSFERAYVLYRTGRPLEALEYLDKCGKDDFRTKELRGQLFYRLERYREGYDVYRDLVKNSTDEFDQERTTNLGACVAALTQEAGLPKGAPKLPESTYELLYNKATVLVAQGEYNEALNLLKKSEELCRKTLGEEEASEEELNDEVSVILAQIGYVNQKMGVPEAANKYYNQVLRNKPSDVAVLAVASNNIISLNKEQNIFDSKKKIKACIAEGIDSKLTKSQRKCIALNNVLLNYYGHSSSELCWRLMRNLEELSSPDEPGLVLLKAALFVKDKQLSKACDVLSAFGQTYKKESLATSLACAQIYLSNKQIEKAAETLENLGDATYTAGVLSALISLCRKLKDDERAAQIFKRAILHHKKNNPKSELLQSLIRKSAQYYLRLGKQKEAAALLQEQRQSDPNNAKLLAQLVAAYSTFDPDKAREVAKDLPNVEVIASQVDVASLEATNWVMGTRHVKKVVASPATKDSPQSGDPSKKEAARKKKKKKGKLPKNYDPNVQPDPERWLPRWERSTFKKRGKRAREAAIGKGPQGAVGNTADLDASNRPTQVVEEIVTPRMKAQKKLGKPQQRKKKGKGKW